MPNRAVVQIAGEAIRMKPKTLLEEFRRAGPLQALLLRFTQNQLERLPLRRLDRAFFGSCGLNPVAVRLKQLLDTISNLFDVVHDQDGRCAVTAHAHKDLSWTAYISANTSQVAAEQYDCLSAAGHWRSG
jgi:hypothetical protein